tara:strand:- start:171 stop:368 length:198 start_codon:yes stop_codon:yes gene_type:complete
MDFLLKNAGILFQKKINILMEEQGSYIKSKEENSLTNLIKQKEINFLFFFKRDIEPIKFNQNAFV